MSFWDFLLGYPKESHKKPIYKPIEPCDTYNPYEDSDLHKVTCIEEYIEAMEKAKRCPACGQYLQYVDTYYGNCPSCDSKYHGAIRRGAAEIKSRGFGLRDVTGAEWVRFYIVSKWLEKGEISQEEAKAYAGELYKQVAANHQHNLEVDRRRAEPNSAKKLSDLISK